MKPATTELIIEQALNAVPKEHKKSLEAYLLNDDGFNRSLFFGNKIGSDAYTFKFTDLVFSAEESESYQSILELVAKLGNITFENCVFYNKEFLLGDLRKEVSGLYYRLCTFKELCFVSDAVVHLQHVGGLFFECVFEKTVFVRDCVRLGAFTSGDDATVFYNCVFRAGLTLNSVNSTSPVMYSDGLTHELKGALELTELNVLNSVFLSRFYIAGYRIKKLKVVNSHFKGKVDAKRLEVDEFVIDDSNFSAVVDFFQSGFNAFRLHKCIFSGFVGFEGCHFSTVAKFDFVTFNSFVNFRSARFDAGLAFKNTNRMELPNFFGCDFSKLAVRNTDRETFRIIKNSFDAVGNHVEGNKFYAKEMHAYERELRADGKNAEQVLLFCNKWFSNFGQSYWLPIAWLLVFSGMFALLVYGHQQDWLYQIAPDYNDTISAVSSFFNRWAAGLVVFKSLMIKGMEFLSLMFGILFSILIWLTITSIKRHTKR